MGNDKELKPLLVALKAEKRAVDYYRRAAARITNPLGKEALNKLKSAEEKHYKNLQSKFRGLVGREPKLEEIEQTEAHIFSLTEEHLPDKEASDLEVCHVAMNDEKEAHSFYLNAAKTSENPGIKQLYEEMAKEEVGHLASLKNICKIISA